MQCYWSISPPASSQVSRCGSLQVVGSTGSQTSAAAALGEPLEQGHPAAAHHPLTPSNLLLPGNGKLHQFLGGSFSVKVVRQWVQLREGGSGIKCCGNVHKPTLFQTFTHFVPFTHLWLSAVFGGKGEH